MKMFIVFTLGIFIFNKSNAQHYPVIFLAGYMGTQIKYYLHKANTSPRFCPHNSPVTTLWLDFFQTQLPYKYCWYHYIRLHYDPIRRTTYSPNGVQIVVPPMGDLKSIEYIAPFPQQLYATSYYIKIIKGLEKIGYVRHLNIRGAPYDWRKAPNEQEEFFIRLKQLIQETYVINGGKPIILFGHSMGGNFAYIFLRQQNIWWKRKYIRAVIFAATPWGGNFKYMYDYIYDDDFASDIIPILREAERSFSSLAFLLPNTRIWGDEPFIITPTTNYSAANIDEFFAVINRPNAFQMWLDTKNLLDPLVHPQVDVFCIIGIGYKTMAKMILNSDDDWSQRQLIYSTGDGFVNIESSLGCLNWFSSYFNFYFKILKSSHLGIIREQDSVSLFVQLISSIS